MVEINMSGRGSGASGRPTYQGAYGGNVQDPGQAARAGGFEAAERANKRAAAAAAAADAAFQRAARQKAGQERQDLAADLRKRRQEDAVYRARQQVEKSNQAQLDRITREQLKQRNDQLRYDAKMAADKRRKDAADQAAADRFQRQQQMDARRRAQQEAMLNRTHGNLAYRAAWNLPPGGFRSVTRGTQVYNERIQAFQSRWGRAPAAPSGATITESLGDMRGAWQTQNIGRLGSRGQRAADTRSWSELAKVERDLSKIDKSVSDQLKFWRSPAQRATVQRQENQMLMAGLVRQQAAVERARQQIDAGTATMSPMLRQFAAGLGGRGGGGGGGPPGSGLSFGGGGGPMGRVARGAGRAFGAATMLATNPELAMLLGGIETAITAPYVGNQMYAGFIGMQKPYMNFRLGMMAAGRGGVSGGMTADEIEGNILPRAGYLPGNARSSRMRMFGLGPLDYQTAWQNAGMNSRTFGQYQGEAESIRTAYATPGNVLPEEAYGKLLGQAKTLGAVTPDAGTRDAYFRKLQEVMTIATAKGVDATQLATSWSNLMQLSTRGVSTNVGGMADFMTKMMGTGSPGMRNGTGVVALASSIQQQALTLGTGGNVAGNVVVSRAMQRAGGWPKTSEALGSFLGFKSDAWKEKFANNDTAQQALTNYLDAVKRGNSPVAATWLGVLMANDPDVYTGMLDKAGLGYKDVPSLRGIALSNFTGTTPDVGVAVQAGRASKAGLGGAAPMPSPAILAAAASASQTTGLPISKILAIGAAESQLDPNAISKTGVRGFMQVTQQTGKDLGFSPSDLSNPTIQATAGAMRYQQMLSLTDGDESKAMMLYNMGPGALPAVRSGRGITDAAQSDADRYTNYQAQYAGMANTFTTLGRGAEGQAAQLEASKYVYESHTLVTGAFDNIVGAATRLIASFDKLGAKINKTMGADAIYPTWDGMPTPSYTPYAQPVK